MRPGFRYAGGLLGGVLAGVVFAGLMLRLWPAPPVLRRACPVMAERGASSPPPALRAAARTVALDAGAVSVAKPAGLAEASVQEAALAATPRSPVASPAIGAAVRPTPATAPAVTQVWSNRHHIASMLVHEEFLWVATHGGVERYGLHGGGQPLPKLVRVYTTLDGLDTLLVRHLVLLDDELHARTDRALCSLRGERFLCEPAPSLPPAAPVTGPRFGGARETARLAHGARRFVGTAGRGLWLDGESTPRLMSAPRQICSNHIMAMASHRGALYLGSFDEGLCVKRPDGFETIRAPFTMVNALVSTPRGLYIATGRGLFVLPDDGRVRAVKALRERGTNGLAYDGRSLFVTTPGALHRVRVDGGPPTRSWWTPAGSRSLQRVAVGGGKLWLASEDRGAIFARRQGRGYLFESFDRMAGLPSSWALDISVDAVGRAYVATLRDGLVTIDRRRRVRRVGPSIEPWLLHVSNSSRGMWVGSQAGAALLDREGKTVALADLPDGRVHAIAEHEAMLFVGTEAGLLQRPLDLALDRPAPQRSRERSNETEIVAQRSHAG
ncbi:MAG: hypothetical protein VB934_09335 [Polyangiaceae bacterium]